MIRKMLAGWLTRLRPSKRPELGLPKNAQVAPPLRVDLPLRERSRALVAVPAQVSGARMGSGKL